MRILVFSVLIVSNTFAQSITQTELNQFWMEASRQVKEGDFQAYANSFHKDAILVNGIRGESIPIQNALNGWKEGFDNTKAGKMNASVEFRFSDHAISETTAYQRGIFLYKWQNKEEEEQEVYIHLEALLTKINGEWQLLMENQKAIATKEEWDSLD